ncbi:copper amine oxidase N-terminal domain-containing protein [Saccharibacillus kuerlensis]|uniref:Copper amine oxidase-like N-terminal domain-containing protein n=1 Tax=Saccharibacillus kuerlensis TaxID=459527 RepID=A0ABQ2KX13_9BACL|nr:copper amine oxidase N-terminal domain-containing protein [Saccharibacillus kuerlensis]GGN95438.1 hypothetical protein GCM10010969_11240 [Saccharibacillus kuerlensis]
MKKRMLLTVPLALGLFASPANASVMQVSVDNKAVTFNTNPLVKENVTMVQVAPIFRSLAISFNWDQQKQQISAVKNGTKMILNVGSRTAYINGQPMRMPLAPTLINGNVFVPLRFVSEAAGAKVNLSGSRISIISANTSSSPNSTDKSEYTNTDTHQETVNDNAAVLEPSEDSIREFLYTYYDTLSTSDSEYEVDYKVKIDTKNKYTVTILLDNYESSGTLYSETKKDGYVMYDLTEEFAFDIAKTFGIHTLYINVSLAPVFNERPEGISSDQISRNDNGSWILLQSLINGSYDFSKKNSQFYDLIGANPKLIASEKWE